MNELVSVVITTYKRDTETLKRAIDSVVSQDYSFFEIIIVDDNDDKNYLQSNKDLIETQFRCETITYLINDGVHGACDARNFGANKSTGQILAFLDDDDSWEPNKLKTMVPLLKDDIGLVYCAANFFRNGVLINGGLEQRKTDNALHDILMTNYIGGCSVPIISKKAFFEVGMFDGRLPSSQDVDLWIRIIKNYKIAYTNEKLVNYYITDDSITRDLDRQTQGRRMVLEKYATDYEKYIDARDSKNNTIFITTVLQGKIVNALKEYNKYYQGRPKAKVLNSYIFIKAIIKIAINKIRGYN